jgi:hypothetical protein
VIPVSFTASDQYAVDEMILCNTGTLDDLGFLDCDNGVSTFKTSFSYNLTSPSAGGDVGEGLKTVYFQVADRLGNWSAPQHFDITYDTTAPSDVVPGLNLQVGRLGTYIPVDITWNAATDSGSGVASYQLRRKAGKNPYHVINGEGVAASSTDQMRKGTNYRYQARSIDNAGNASTWSEELVCKAVIRQESSSAVTRSGKWSSKSVSGASAGGVLRSSQPGAWVRTTFTGFAIGWVSSLGPTMGSADILVDGIKVDTVNLYRSSASTRQIVWSKSFAAGGTHTLQVRVVGSSGHPAVDLDGFVVLSSS